MDPLLLPRLAIRARILRRNIIRRPLHSTPPNPAVPLPHVAPGPPPNAPEPAFSAQQHKRQKADLLIQSQKTKVNPAQPSSALAKRFWKNVAVAETEEGHLKVLLDQRPVRIANKTPLTLPKERRGLAMGVAVEWDSLVTAKQALKEHHIPLTSLTSRALDLETADKTQDARIREQVVSVLMRYLSTDTLLCWAPTKSLHDPAHEGQKNLRQRQREVAEPIIAFLTTHVFPGVEIRPILGESSILPVPQPEETRSVIRSWVTSLPPFELAALERGVLATKSLLVAARLLVEWSRHFGRAESSTTGDKLFGVEEAAEAATLEVMHQVQQWGEVEDTHDVEKEDLRRQLGSVVLLVS